MRFRIHAALLLGTILMLPIVAQAAGLGPCTEDARRLCKDVRPGPGKRLECVRQHRSEVSAACESHLQRLENPLGACREDVARLCPKAAKGGSRLVICLRKNEKSLSAACREQFRSRRRSAAP